MRHSPQSPLPQTWMSTDIKLGALSLHLEDTSWLKGAVDDNASHILNRMMGIGEEGTTSNTKPSVVKSTGNKSAAAAASSSSKKNKNR